MRYAIEALRPDGTTVAECIEAGDRHAAVESLREKGLMVLRLEEQAGESPARAPAAHGPGSRITGRDLVLFTRQMKMLLEAGAPVVPALEAAGQQNAKPAMRALLERVRLAVEEGDSLADALDKERTVFDPVFRSMIAAGEATASLPQVFGRLGALAEQRQQVRKMVVGALLYPAVLSVLLVGVVGVLLFFVVPRFSVLFLNLNSPLPASTKLLFELSGTLKEHWPYPAAGVVALLVAFVVAWHLPNARTWLDDVLLRLPLVGRVTTRLTLARVVRVWAAMLRCHVPLLEAIRQSREAVNNARFLRLITQVEEAVASGGRMAQALATTGLADPILVSALRTGEENGRLAEAVDFVSGWLDEDNATLMAGLTRLAEPLLLAFMGVVVGFVAMSLFLPLFDMATAA